MARIPVVKVKKMTMANRLAMLILRSKIINGSRVLRNPEMLGSHGLVSIFIDSHLSRVIIHGYRL